MVTDMEMVIITPILRDTEMATWEALMDMETQTDLMEM
jgi:hypothetical protein